MIDYLIESINSGSFDAAGSLAGQLADLHVDVQFNLVNKIQSIEEKIPKPELNTDMRQSPDSILQFVLTRIWSLILHFDIQILSSNRMSIQRSYQHDN